MAFLAAAAPALGTGIGVSTTAGAALNAALGGMAITSASAGAIATGAAAPLALTGTTAAGAGFWSTLGTVASVVSTAGSIFGTISAGRAQAAATTENQRALALDNARAERDLARDRGAAAARRATSLAVQGGLQDGSELVREALTEGSIESVRRSADISFSQGVLSRRQGNIRSGTNFSTLAALASGGARIGSLLA